MNIILNKEQLIEALDFYQGLLRIRDWDITVEICRFDEMEHGGIAGACRWVAESRMAKIKLLDPNDAIGFWNGYDMEHVLCHEIAHVLCAQLDDLARGPGKNSNPLEVNIVEHVVESMADALTKLRRQGNHKFSWEK